MGKKRESRDIGPRVQPLLLADQTCLRAQETCNWGRWLLSDNTYHLAASKIVRQPAEEDLPNEDACVRRRLQSLASRTRQYPVVPAKAIPRSSRGALPKGKAQKDSNEINSEDVVAIQEEAHACYENGSDVIQAEWDFVDLGQCEPSTQIRVLYM